MKKVIFGFSLFVVGMLSTGCIDKHEEVDEDSKPSWLGSSIYEELSNPKEANLEGTFKTYLWIVDKLGYGEVLKRTGSKTIFPANDDAFERFFAEGGNEWGVRHKEDLTEAQLKMLLYTSMLDNAMLVNMMSNVSSGNSVQTGVAMKHATSLSNTDTITRLEKPSESYPNNPYFKPYDNTGMYTIGDATSQMMIHFTREYMINNSLTTLGKTSDFSVLMGTEYKEGDAYVFRNKITHPDVTCQNGYIHQVQDVVTQPGNIVQVLKKGSDTKYISRMFDRFAMPKYNGEVTVAYNDWAVQNDRTTIDSIFEIRYMSEESYDNGTQTDPAGNSVSSFMLPFDPGWNAYYSGSNGQYSDIAAVLVPTDSAVQEYFLPGGAGAFLITQYGQYQPNTLENLPLNIDCIPQDKVKVLLTNLMKMRMTNTVPSLFYAVTNTASDLMGLTLNDLLMKDADSYDVRIANNGVIYMLNRMIAPPEFSAVSAPATIRDDMKVVNWIIQNKSRNGSDVNKYSLGLDYYAYLLAMSANFAQFLPNDNAFDEYYVNPASLSTERPEALRFYCLSGKSDTLFARRYDYNPTTRTVGAYFGDYDLLAARQATVPDLQNVVKYILSDLINMHTIVLNKGEQLGDRHYYITKLGAGLKLTGNSNPGQVGGTIATSFAHSSDVPVPEIIDYNTEENGVAYELNHVIQAPTQSVYSVLKNNPNTSEFLKLCTEFDNPDLMDFLGISSEEEVGTGIRPIDQYLVFWQPHGPGYKPGAEDPSVNSEYTFATYKDDYVVKFFSTYNYTVYAPTNVAMEAAYTAGLPRWSDILSMYQDYEANGNLHGYADADAFKAALLEKVKLLRQFARYHFQNTSVFSDIKPISDNTFQTFMADENSINQKLEITVGGNGDTGRLEVKDAYNQKNGGSHVILDDGAAGKMVNVMTRDVILDKRYDKATRIYTSSFAVVHEIDQALCPDPDGTFTKLIFKAPRRLR